MLQRKQTLFLAASVVVYVLTYYMPFAHLGSLDFYSFAIQDLSGTDSSAASSLSLFGFGYVLAIGATLTLLSIFLYANRSRQMMVLRLSFIFYALSFALLAWSVLKAHEQIAGQSFSFGPSFFYALASFVLNMAALRYIRKDEKLIRSLDRLR